MNTFFIQNEKGEGLHYIQGNLYWRKPDTVENVTNFTSFNTVDEAVDFARERKMPGELSVGQIIYTVLRIGAI